MSTEALNCGNAFERGGDDLEQRSPSPSACRRPSRPRPRYCLRSCSSVGDVGLVELGDVRNRRSTRGSGARPSCGGCRVIGLRSTSPHLREVGQRRRAAGARAAAAAAGRRCRLCIAAWRAPSRRPARCGRRGRCPAPGVMSTPSSRASRRTDGAAGAAGRRAAPTARRAARPPRTARPRCRAGRAALRRPPPVGVAALRCRRLPSGGRLPPVPRSARGAAASRTRLPSPARQPLHRCAAPRRRSTTWPTLTLSPALTVTSVTVPATDDGTSMVALSVSSSSTGWSTCDRVARLDQHARTSPLVDVLAQFGQFEFVDHGVRSRLQSARLDRAGSVLSGSMLEVLDGLRRRPSASICPSRASAVQRRPATM